MMCDCIDHSCQAHPGRECGQPSTLEYDNGDGTTTGLCDGCDGSGGANEGDDDSMEAIAAQAKEMARKALIHADWSLDWRSAGYPTALAAARAMVGDSGAPDVCRMAAVIVAAWIE